MSASAAGQLQSQGMTRQRQQFRATPYAAPAAELVQTTTAEELLHGARPISGKAHQISFVELAFQRPLWCVGDTEILQRPCVAVIGTRNVSPDGAARARRLARELVQAGVVVVSGLARGVDTKALAAAVEAGGRVVAVIGTPLDKASPAENRPLQELIYREHLLISQFPVNSPVTPGNFPERNRTMALLTDASVIIEAGETSGTLHQAAECVRLGRWLFIAKSVIEDPSLTWPFKFRDYPNVRPLSSTSDILTTLAR